MFYGYFIILACNYTYSPIAQWVSASDFDSENTGSNPVRVARGRQKDKSNAMEK